MASESIPGERTGTIHSLQMLRMIAATLVAVFHAHLAFSTRVSEQWFAIESYVFGFGAVGVHIFFVISGFIMVVTSFAKGNYDAASFVRRRLLRIYPIYWLVAFAYLAVHWVLGRPYELPGETIAGALVLWPESAAAIIGPAWTLSYEMYFYMCFGLAMMLGLNRGLFVLGATFAASILGGLVLRPEAAFAQLATNSLLVEFLAGTAIGWMAIRGRLPNRAGPALVAIAAGLFAAGAAIGYERGPSALIWGIPSAILVLGMVAWESRSGASPLVRAVGRLGDSSYVLYLIHVLAITLTVELAWRLDGSTSLAPASAGLIIGAGAVAIAHLVHLGVELPMLRLLNPRRPLVAFRRSAATQP